MAFRELRREDDAVSPVIGVVLTAVIASFVLGLGVTITHEGGDDIDSANFEEKDDDGNTITPFSGTLSAGSSVSVQVGTDDTVRIVWADTAGGSTSTIGTFEA